MNENRKMLVLLGAMTIFAAVGFTYFAIKIGAVDVTNQQSFKLHFDSAVGIPDNADVRVYGIKVGTVKRMDLADKRGAFVWIGIRPDYPVYADARAVIKAKSLLGERFIELQPGEGPERLASGSAITDTITPIRLEDLGEIFGPLMTSVDSEQVQLAFSTLLEVITENREAIKQGGKAFATALTRMSTMIDDEEDIVRLKSFLDSLTDLVVRLDKITGENEEVLVQVLKDAGASMADIRELMSSLKSMSKDFPDTGADLSHLLKTMVRVTDRLESIDMRKVGLILKKVMQQEGLTFSVRGYKMDDLREQMDSYDRIMEEDFDPGPGKDEVKKSDDE